MDSRDEVLLPTVQRYVIVEDSGAGLCRLLGGVGNGGWAGRVGR